MTSAAPSDSAPSRAQIATAWLALAGWLLMVWTFSGDAFSADKTARSLRAILEWLVGGLGPEDTDSVHYVLRKSAHAVEYALLALLAQRAFRLSFSLTPLAAAGFSLGLVLVVAGADELRQRSSHARGGSLADVALDASGALAALALVVQFRRGRPGPADAPRPHA